MNSALMDGKKYKLIMLETLDKIFDVGFNFRGVTISRLIGLVQKAEEFIWVRDSLPKDEWEESSRYYHHLLRCVLVEIARREKLSYSGIQRVNSNIIKAIKESMGENGLVEVLSWYTQVSTHKRQWTFRCTLHGQDKDPSGKIYPDELRWWCYGCNQGGDIFDAVVAFERISLIDAIKKLAKHTGFSLDVPKPPPQKGGISLKVNNV